MFKLNNKQREILSSSLVKIAEYVLLTLIIGQLALGKFDVFLFFYSSLLIVGIYFISMYILSGFEEKGV